MSRTRLRRFARRSRKRVFKTPRRSVKRARFAAIAKPRRSVKMGKGFPAKITFTHKYVETVTLATPTFAGYSVYRFVANDLFKPNDISTGHKPLGFNQMGALYNHFTVIGSKIRVKACRVRQNTDNSGDVMQVALYLDDDATAPVNYQTMLEQNRVKSWVLGEANSEGASDKSILMTCNFSARKQFGKGSLNNSRLLGNTTGPPVEKSYYVIAATSQTIVPQTILLQVEISYIAVWTEVKDITGSS